MFQSFARLSALSDSTGECPKLETPETSLNVETADVCLGWFWGPDAHFSGLQGVKEVIVGYAGGQAAWPTYRSIKDHTEAVRIVYDPNVITYDDILNHFVNEAGPSTSPPYSRQYRTAVLVHSSTQRILAERKIEGLSKKYGGRRIYIDIEDATDFYRAEEYHQKYYAKSCGGSKYF